MNERRPMTLNLVAAMASSMAAASSLALRKFGPSNPVREQRNRPHSAYAGRSDGGIVVPSSSLTAKVKGRDRNQPCPCGSGRKVKHCCRDKAGNYKKAEPAATTAASEEEDFKKLAATVEAHMAQRSLIVHEEAVAAGAMLAAPVMITNPDSKENALCTASTAASTSRSPSAAPPTVESGSAG